MKKSVYTSEQLVQLTTLMTDQNMTPTRLQKILKAGILTDVFDEKANLSDRSAVCSALKLGLERLGIYQFSIDYEKPVEVRIAACKKAHPWQIDLPEQHFTCDQVGSIKFEAQLLQLPRLVSRRVVLGRIASLDKTNPWVPADPDHMLAFATKHPHLNWQSGSKYTVGLGSTASVLLGVFQGFGCGMSYHFTQLTTRKNAHTGGPEDRFLVVRKAKL